MFCLFLITCLDLDTEEKKIEFCKLCLLLNGLYHFPKMTFFGLWCCGIYHDDRERTRKDLIKEARSIFEFCKLCLVLEGFYHFPKATVFGFWCCGVYENRKQPILEKFHNFLKELYDVLEAILTMLVIYHIWCLYSTYCRGDEATRS